jgi:hypothetical protein
LIHCCSSSWNWIGNWNTNKSTLVHDSLTIHQQVVLQIGSVSVTSHDPLCAEEMRGSNHFMLAGSGNQSEPPHFWVCSLDSKKPFIEKPSSHVQEEVREGLIFQRTCCHGYQMVNLGMTERNDDSQSAKMHIKLLNPGTWGQTCGKPSTSKQADGSKWPRAYGLLETFHQKKYPKSFSENTVYREQRVLSFSIYSKLFFFPETPNFFMFFVLALNFHCSVLCFKFFFFFFTICFNSFHYLS